MAGTWYSVAVSTANMSKLTLIHKVILRFMQKSVPELDECTLKTNVGEKFTDICDDSYSLSPATVRKDLPGNCQTSAKSAEGHKAADAYRPDHIFNGASDFPADHPCNTPNQI